jgi:ER membrane protein complex subunit 6
MTSRIKSRETKSGEIIAYSESAVRQNLMNIEYVKTSLSCKNKLIHSKFRVFINSTISTALAGITAGILGLTGLLGFIFYIAALLAFFGLLVFKTGSNWKDYFMNRNVLLTNGFLGGLCTYTLFWTFAYGTMHVY